MTPPLWLDEHGQPRPTRPCPRCGRDIPVNRWPARTLRTQGWGLIAEEVATVYPELVTHTATGEVQAVHYQELIPTLVNELQRQPHVTEHLQRELAELRILVGQMRGGIAQR